LEKAIVTTLFAALFILYLLLSIGASSAKPWARTGSRVIAIPMLIAFPAGTIAALYILSNCNTGWEIKRYGSSLLDGFPNQNPKN